MAQPILSTSGGVDDFFGGGGMCFFTVQIPSLKKDFLQQSPESEI